MIIDCSSTPLIGCCKQPVKYADLSILEICEDTSTFFNMDCLQLFIYTAFIFLSSTQLSLD